MIGTLVALAVVGTMQETPSPSKLIASALEHYSSAKTISGRVIWTQTAMNAKVETVSDLVILRPSRIILKQSRTGKDPRSWALTSDGVVFTYDRPETNPLLPDRLAENVTQDERTLTVQDMYMAASGSLGDRSAVLDIAVSHPGYLKLFTSRLASLEFGGKYTVGNVPANLVKGTLRVRPSEPPTGSFELYLSQAGDILKYVENFRVAQPKSSNAIEVTSTWDVDLKVGEPIDETAFQVVR